VFVLTHFTFSRVETVAELDLELRLQWSWGDALDAALSCDYIEVERFLSTGKVVSADAAFAALDISGRKESSVCPVCQHSM
jgi:hypothetical protein